MNIKKTTPSVSVDIPITTEFIKLESFLKFAGAMYSVRHNAAW
jgi:hypothetical protein